MSQKGKAKATVGTVAIGNKHTGESSSGLLMGGWGALLRVLAVTVAGTAAAGTSGCTQPDVGKCDAGSVGVCLCEGDANSRGTHTCNEEGTGFSACVCEASGVSELQSAEMIEPGGTDPDLGMDVGPGTGSEDLLDQLPSSGRERYQACASDAECASGLCGPGYCSEPCATTAGCGIEGYCVEVQPEMGLQINADAICLMFCDGSEFCSQDAGYDGASCVALTEVAGAPAMACATWDAALTKGSYCSTDTPCSNGTLHSGTYCGESGRCEVGGCEAVSDCSKAGAYACCANACVSESVYDDYTVDGADNAGECIR